MESPLKFLRLLIALALLSSAAAEPSGKRRALVIGNSEYHKLTALPSVSQDASSMSQALKDADFEVEVFANLTWSDFFAKEDEFLKKVQAGDICFVYYSGYAVQGDSEDDN